MIHRAKKSLGQNFLKSKRALDAIVDAGDIQGDDVILEIGPGKGALTEKLVFFSGKVIAVEKDDDLFTFLQEKYATEIKKNKLDLIHGDILNFDSQTLSFYKNHEYKIIANIPYNITGQIIRMFLTAETKPERMVLLVQKEVSDRIVARDGKESLLSLSVKLYGTPKYIMKVPARDFSPAPKVDSAILLIKDIKKPALNREEEAFFFDLIHAGFAHKRKVLRSNLSTLITPTQIESLFEKEGIKPTSRAEELTLPQWISLTKAICAK